MPTKILMLKFNFKLKKFYFYKAIRFSDFPTFLNSFGNTCITFFFQRIFFFRQIFPYLNYLYTNIITIAANVPNKFPKISKYWKDLLGITRCDNSENNDNAIRKIKTFIKLGSFK